MAFQLTWQFNVELLVRIFLGMVCGFFIGYERKNRNKEAGVRTHVIVCMAAALLIIISKYGFFDVVIHDGIDADASRVAAQIVSGVGFLGAGMIFVKKEMVSGLTTAAGIWATAGIGMAIGSGLYIIGIVSALFIVALQTILHLPRIEPYIQEYEILHLELRDMQDFLAIQSSIESNGYKVSVLQLVNNDVSKHCKIDLQLTLKRNHNPDLIIHLIQEFTSIIAIKK